MKNVLLLVHDDAGQEARLQAALDITRAIEGHLTCLDVEILLDVAGDYNGGYSAILQQEERARESANRSVIDARLQHEGVSWSWIEAFGTPASCVRDAAHLADVVVVNRRLESLPGSVVTGAVDEIIIKAGTPVVIVTEPAQGFASGGHALIAWNGSAAASAALRAAVPLLALAETVTILVIDDRMQTGDVGEAASYLSRHGIHPVIATVPALEHDTATTLLHEVAARGASYLVMGGFGHSRLREAIFGGITRTMLASCPVPLIMAH